MTTITEAIDLRDRRRAHRNDECAASNTIFAAFGVNSSLGRYADTSAYRNETYAIWLEDVAYDAGWDGPSDEERREWHDFKSVRPRSSVAAAMIEHGLRRSERGNKRVPMTAPAHAALVAYFEEKLRLMREIDVIADRASRDSSHS
jgi:hypothetical protein